MSKGYYPIKIKDWPECSFLGCIHNKNGQCISVFVNFKIEKKIIIEDFDCSDALVPADVCDFCGAELIEFEGCKTCPNGCF